jgi:hypothetical protein
MNAKYGPTAGINATSDDPRMTTASSARSNSMPASLSAMCKETPNTTVTTVQ